MPQGSPGTVVSIRIDPALWAAVRAVSGNMSATVAEALREWLRRRELTTERKASRQAGRPARG
jgi:hypothetical protein